MKHEIICSMKKLSEKSVKLINDTINVICVFFILVITFGACSTTCIEANKLNKKTDDLKRHP